MTIEGECGVSTVAESKKTNSIDMLHGPLAKKIVLFSIPLAITSILQQLLNSTDAVFAGQWLGGDALAAVGGVAPIISLFVAVFVGLSVGVNVVIAVHIGHDDIDKIRGAVQTSAAAAVICSLVLAVAGVLSTDFILAAVNMPAEAWAEGAQYLLSTSSASFSWLYTTSVLLCFELRETRVAPCTPWRLLQCSILHSITLR